MLDALASTLSLVNFFLIFVAFVWMFVGINGGMNLRDGSDASGRKGKVCAFEIVLSHISTYN